MKEEAPSNLPKTVTMTRDGGNYWRAMMFALVITWTLAPVMLILLLFAIINPFWFRDQCFNWAERNTNRFVRWRNRRQYAIYLGCDPEVWHALKK